MYLVSVVEFKKVGLNSINRYGTHELFETQSDVLDFVKSVGVKDPEGNLIDLTPFEDWLNSEVIGNAFVTTIDMVRSLRGTLRTKPEGTVYHQIEICNFAEDYAIVLFTPLLRIEEAFVCMANVVKYELDFEGKYLFMTDDEKVYQYDRKLGQMVERDTRMGLSAMNSNGETLRNKIEFYKQHKDRFIFIFGTYKYQGDRYTIDKHHFGRFFTNLDKPIVDIEGNPVIIVNREKDGRKIAIKVSDFKTNFELA